MNELRSVVHYVNIRTLKLWVIFAEMFWLNKKKKIEKLNVAHYICPPSTGLHTYVLYHAVSVSYYTSNR